MKAEVYRNETAAQNTEMPKDVEPATQQANAAVLKELNFNDREDFEDAQRGFIAAPLDAVIKGADGHEVWNSPAFVLSLRLSPEARIAQFSRFRTTFRPLTYMPNTQAPNADATFMLTRAVLDAITLGKTTFEKEVVAGNIKIQGNGRKFGELMSLLDDFKGGFNIVTP